MKLKYFQQTEIHEEKFIEKTTIDKTNNSAQRECSDQPVLAPSQIRVFTVHSVGNKALKFQ